MDHLDPGSLFAAIAGTVMWRDVFIVALVAMAATPLMLARPPTTAVVVTIVLAATGLLQAGLSVEIAVFAVLFGLVFLIATLLSLDRRHARRLEDDCRSLADRLHALELAEARLQQLSALSPMSPALGHGAHRLAILSEISGAEPAPQHNGQAAGRELPVP